MGMVGARELLPARGARRSRRGRARCPGAPGVIRPRLYVIPDGYPRALCAGRGARGGAALAVSSGLLGVATPAELEGIVAHEIAHLRSRDVLTQTIVTIVRGGDHRVVADRRLLPARVPVRARADRGLVRASGALAEARVRGGPLRGRPLRLAARPRGRAAPARAVDGARRSSRRARRRSRSTRPTRSPTRGSAALFQTHPPLGERVQRLRDLDAGLARAASRSHDKGPLVGAPCLKKEMGGVLLSRGIAPRVPSALAGLTSLFGMGRGVSPPL